MAGNLYFINIRVKLPVLIYLLSLIILHFNITTEGGIIIYDGEDNMIEEFYDTELSFATVIKSCGIKGTIVSANPPDACSQISAPPTVNCSQNWFVLIAGNSCNYNIKVYFAELAGYSAAVIYNMKNTDDGPPENYFDYISNISAVAIRTSSGLIIKENYLYTIDKRYRMLIYPYNVFNIMTFLLLFTIVAGIFILVVFSFMDLDLADTQPYAFKLVFFYKEVSFAICNCCILGHCFNNTTWYCKICAAVSFI